MADEIGGWPSATRVRREQCDFCIHNFGKEWCNARELGNDSFIRLVGEGKRRCKDFREKKKVSVVKQNIRGY